MGNKEDIIIYGAGSTGKKIFNFIEDWYNVLFFVDSDKNKNNTLFCGKKVYSPEKLKEYLDVKVIIGSIFYEEIYNKLTQLKVSKILMPEFFLRLTGGTILNELNNRAIDLGRFFENEKIEMNKLTYMSGGSGVLDYAFLRALVIKFNLKNYLEIGTYIGESINNVADLCERCHSVTLLPGEKYSMKNWCKTHNIPDYSERLATLPNIIHHNGDSKEFDFSSTKDEIDIYFIDGDHSYSGVKADTENIFRNRKPDSFVVWHDFKTGTWGNPDVILAVKDALKEEFKNIFITSNNMCGIYIPEKFQKHFDFIKYGYTEKQQDLYFYQTSINVGMDKAEK